MPENLEFKKEIIKFMGKEITVPWGDSFYLNTFLAQVDFQETYFGLGQEYLDTTLKYRSDFISPDIVEQITAVLAEVHANKLVELASKEHEFMEEIWNMKKPSKSANTFHINEAPDLKDVNFGPESKFPRHKAPELEPDALKRHQSAHVSPYDPAEIKKMKDRHNDKK